MDNCPLGVKLPLYLCFVEENVDLCLLHYPPICKLQLKVEKRVKIIIYRVISNEQISQQHKFF